MKHSILLITILLAAIDNSSAQERPAMARYAKGYKGYEGLRIAVSPYADMKRALVMFYGINHPWDRKIFLCDMNEVQSSVNPRIEYQTLIDGQQWNLLIVSPQGTGEAFMKDVKYARPVSYDEETSRDINNEHQLTQYLEQEARARQEKRKK
jgi:hypothetical protein